jgi:hypothetical protein
MSSLFWTNLEQEKKSGEGRSEGMSAIGQKVICLAVCLHDMIKTGCIEDAKTARSVALHARVCCSQAMKAALCNFACMLLLGLLKGGRLIALVTHPQSKNDPGPHVGKRPHGYRMAFAFSSFALIILPGPWFTLRRLPRELMQSVAQGFDTAQSAMGFGLLNTVQLRRTQDTDSCDQFNDLMKIQIKFQRRSMQMLRFLALIARADPFDDTSLNTHALFGQALLADLFEHTLNHVLPTRCTDHTQRNQILVHDTDGFGETDLGWRDLSLFSSDLHERADADNASGYAAYTLMPAGASILTVEYKLNLLAPGDGDLLIARGYVVKAGRTLTVCRSDIVATKQTGEQLCATALVTLMTLAGKPDRPVAR